LLEPKTSWEFFENQAKIEGRCTLKEKKASTPQEAQYSS